MQDGSLVEILRTFSEAEVKKFSEYLNSPYFNKKPTVIRLWEDIKRFSPVYNNPELEREKVYKRIVPGKPYNYGTMKNMIHDLTILAQSFLARNINIDSEFGEDFRMLRMFLERGLKQQFIKAMDKKLEFFNEKKYSFGDFEKVKILCEMCNELGLSNYSSHKPFETVKYSYFSFVETYVACYNNIRVGKNDFADKKALLSEEEIVSSIEVKDHALKLAEENTRDEMIVKYYLMLADAYKNLENVNLYYDAKQYLGGIHDLFEPSSLNYCYRMLANVVLSLKPIPLNKRMAEFYDITALLIRNNIMFPPERTIGIIEFSNTIKIMNESELILKLINDNLKYIEPDYRDNMKAYAMAHYYYLCKEYGKMMEVCSLIKFDLYLFKADIKAIQLKALYEMNDYESYKYQADSFIRTIPKTKSLRDDYIKCFVSLSEIIAKLFRYRETGDSRYFLEIKKELETQKVHSNVWVMNRLEEIENSAIAGK